MLAQEAVTCALPGLGWHAGLRGGRQGRVAVVLQPVGNVPGARCGWSRPLCWLPQPEDPPVAPRWGWGRHAPVRAQCPAALRGPGPSPRASLS